MTSTTVRERVAGFSAQHRTQARLVGVVGATLAALVVWIVVVQLLGVDLLARSTGSTKAQAVGVAPVVIEALIAALLGWALLAVLERFTRRARTIWTVVALVVLLLSLSGPLTGGVTTATKVSLSLMHIALAAVLIPTMRVTSPRA
jgi:hypothetical protein